MRLLFLVALPLARASELTLKLGVLANASKHIASQIETLFRATGRPLLKVGARRIYRVAILLRARYGLRASRAPARRSVFFGPFDVDDRKNSSSSSLVGAAVALNAVGTGDGKFE